MGCVHSAILADAAVFLIIVVFEAVMADHHQWFEAVGAINIVMVVFLVIFHLRG